MAGSTAQSATDMKTGQLKQLLANLPDDMEVVVTGHDHSFLTTDRGSGVKKADATINARGQVKHLGIHYDGHDPEGTILVEVFWIDDGRY